MKQRFGVFATLVFAGTFVSPESVQGQPEVDLASGLTLSVQIYNWAKVSRATLQKGQGVAENAGLLGRLQEQRLTSPYLFIPHLGQELIEAAKLDKLPYSIHGVKVEVQIMDSIQDR